MVAFRYSEWDGTQEIPPLDADEVLEALTDDLMNFGDLQHAMRNLLQRGMRNPMGNRLQGLRDLLQQLRQQRRNTLDKYNLSSVMDDIKKRLDELLEMERSTIDRRLEEVTGEKPDGGAPAGQQGQQQPGDGQQGQRQSGDGQQGEQQSGDGQQGQQQRGGQRSGQQQGLPSMSGAPSPGGQQGQSGQQGGDGQQGTGQQQGQGGDTDQFAEMLKNIANRKKNFLSNLPEDLPGAVKELQNYEFMDPDAQHKYTELMEMLKKAMTDTFFKDMYDQIANMSPEDMARMKQMVKDLNQMLSDKLAGGEPDFEQFMQQYGDLFGPNPPQSLDELIQQMQGQIAQMQNLLDSMPGDMRQQLQDLLSDKIGDPDLQAELSELGSNLEFLSPMRDMRNQYPFRGDEEIDLNEAMRLMDRMQSMDDLERQLERTQYGGDVDDIDEEKLRELLGDEAAETLDQLKQFLEILEESGYIRRKGNTWELTPRGTRKIGQKALGEIYSQLKHDSFGKHALRDSGRGGERADDTKKYEFGDPFHLSLESTIKNAITREGASIPVRLDKEDFEVYRSEELTQTATVMMVDLSWSMALRGSFQAAKKVALALNNLIRSQFSRDSLYIIGFSAYARELQAEQLPYVRWDESVLGTNMHHALMLAQNLLSKHKGGTRQIIMISDGEPTAHLERGRSYFAYPPSPITIRETLKEVKRATQKGITINTFMLDRNYYLKEFVNQVAKINKGRVFYTSPDKLGQYILVDYVQNKRKNVRGT
ncbi:MAG TPA: VWA domain-containing protein [Dehalococcoidia bacterium]|nr:VWA domain-containing protein [Dehalococcoidia bacterium]